MGVLSKIITQIAVKKAEKAISGRIEKEIAVNTEKQKLKEPIFKSRLERAEFTSLYFFATQLIYTIILVVWQEGYLSWAVFYRSYAMAALVSFALLLVGLFSYGLYRIDFLPLLFLLLPLPLCFIIPIGFEYGFGVFRDFFFGTWMNTTTKMISVLLGIAAIISSFSVLIYYESGGSRKKMLKQTPAPTSDEEAEKNRSLLRSAIQNNAINIRFLKRKWNFSTSADVLFGYDNQNKQFVFVSDQNSYVLSGKKVVYLDFEDVTSPSDVATNTNEYQRLIKLFYLGTGKKESILSLAQIYATDGDINRIKYYANNNPAGNSEVVFRRKIRHLASSLEREFYPCRPFVNDEWFDLLKGSMEKIKNNNTDGYSLFRDKVIASEDYMDNETLFSIICDLSVDPPDKASAKKEAKRLCLNDFGATLGNNIKSSVRSIFSNGK